MKYEDYKYIICDANKAPTHSFDTAFTFNKVHDKENLAIRIEEPYVIIDLDNEDEFSILYQIIKDLGIKTRVMKTSRGGHFWFKTAQPMTNSTHINTPLTLTIDIKCWGKRTMEVVKRNNVWREWLQFDSVVDEVPFFIKPIRVSKSLLGMDDGDGRNDALFTFIMPLLNEGLSKDEIKQLFVLVNKYIFKNPLTQSEIDAMVDTNPIFTNISTLFYKGTAFQHSTFADYIIKEFNVKSFGGALYHYDFDENVYVTNDDLLLARMINIIPHLKKNNIKEAFENIRLKVLLRPSKVNNAYINLNNGLYDWHRDVVIGHSPDIFTVNKIPCTYNPSIQSEAVDKFLDSVCCKDDNIKTLMIQMIGYCLIPDTRFQKAFILLGGGSNGKSIMLDMIRNTLGFGNCCSLALEDLSKPFVTAELSGKMANIGDDSGAGLLDNTAIFKKLVTGNGITTSRKFGQPFELFNSAKMLFAANNLPPTSDKSDGFFRRCIIVPFKAKFSPNIPGYDPYILDKIITEEAKSHILNLAIKGLKQLLRDNRFIEPGEVTHVSEEYEISNNTVLQWWKSNNGTFYDKIADAFKSYVGYCVISNCKPLSINRFQAEYTKIEEKYK